MEIEPLRLEVDGEEFVVRQRSESGIQWDYDWVSGPNKGYGFSSALGGPMEITHEHHVQNIRSFLAMVDPETGYIEDE